jgi:hypothetical protein
MDFNQVKRLEWTWDPNSKSDDEWLHICLQSFDFAKVANLCWENTFYTFHKKKVFQVLRKSLSQSSKISPQKVIGIFCLQRVCFKVQRGPMTTLYVVGLAICLKLRCLIEQGKDKIGIDIKIGIFSYLQKVVVVWYLLTCQTLLK